MAVKRAIACYSISRKLMDLANGGQEIGRARSSSVPELAQVRAGPGRLARMVPAFPVLAQARVATRI